MLSRGARRIMWQSTVSVVELPNDEMKGESSEEKGEISEPLRPLQAWI